MKLINSNYLSHKILNIKINLICNVTHLTNILQSKILLFFMYYRIIIYFLFLFYLHFLLYIKQLSNFSNIDF